MPAGLRISSDAAGPPVYALEGPTVALEVDLTVFALPAVMRACYHWTDRCFLFVNRSSAQTLTIFLQPKAEDSPMGSLVGDFANTLLDAQLRVTIGEEIGAIRELVVAQAFAEGNLLDENRDNGDYQADPLGIGRRR